MGVRVYTRTCAHWLASWLLYWLGHLVEHSDEAVGSPLPRLQPVDAVHSIQGELDHGPWGLDLSDAAQDRSSRP